MDNNLQKYLKRFVNRNLINDSLRDNRNKEANNFTTITDLLLISILPIITLINLYKKISNRKNK